MSFKEQVEQSMWSKKIIGEHLLKVALTDTVFAEKLETKDLDKCFDFIKKEASKQSQNGVAMISDVEVFGWAIHFVDEETKTEDATPPQTVSPIKEKKRNVIEVQIEETKKTIKKLEKQLGIAQEKVTKAEKEQLENPTDLFAFLEEDSEAVTKAKKEVERLEGELADTKKKLDTLALDATKGKPEEETEGDENDEDCDSCELDSDEDSSEDEEGE